jgi:hypothetical protein
MFLLEAVGVVTARFAELPKRVARLPKDPRGFPIPWFVSWRDGQPHFPAIDAAKLGLAWNEDLCWVCGEKLGANRGWVVGPMSAIEGATPEPSSHYDCALFSVCHCPHLSTSTASFTEKYQGAPGYAAQTNISKVRTGATAIWVTKGRGATPFRAGQGTLFGLSEPVRLEWYAEGRPAATGEVRHAIAVALPTLQKAAEMEGRRAELERRLEWLERLVPS